MYNLKVLDLKICWTLCLTSAQVAEPQNFICRVQTKILKLYLVDVASITFYKYWFYFYSDPKDGRGLYVIYNNGIANSASLHRLSKSTSSEAILTWDFTIQQATIGWTNDILTIVILPEGSNQLRLYAVHKTDGFRSRHPGCSSCTPLEIIGIES